jgi:hypothetical protein
LNDNENGFISYIANSLKADLYLKEDILCNIAARDSTTLTIEKRMLMSVNDIVKESQLSEEQITKYAKEFPDLKTMMSAIGMNDTVYITLQRMGSHAVHGTWSELLFNYVEKNAENEYYASKGIVSHHHNQFAVVIYCVLMALEEYTKRVQLGGAEGKTKVLEHISEVRNRVREIDILDYGKDFLPSTET